jgi:hypothetical protein
MGLFKWVFVGFFFFLTVFLLVELDRVLILEIFSLWVCWKCVSCCFCVY